MDKIIHKIANFINKKDKKIIIGISGHGASGKTTFANHHEERRIQYDLFMHPCHRKFDIVIKSSNEEIIYEKIDLD